MSAAEPRYAFCLECGAQVVFVESDVRERQLDPALLRSAVLELAPTEPIFVEYVTCSSDTCGKEITLGVPFFRSAKPARKA